jgi:agmatine deiminase
MPAEFEKHSGCWILWPERLDNWRLNAKPAQKVFAEVAKIISKFEPVTVGVSQKNYDNARNILAADIGVVILPNNDSWVRDTGPTFLVNKNNYIRGVDWDFNAWGGLYSSWEKDNLVAKEIIKIEGMDYYKANMVLEGGAINVDGAGTLITTEECLLNQNRNPNLSKKEVEGYLREYTSVKKIIWLKKGVYMDEVNGHIDNLCRFVQPGVVVLLWTDNRNDPQYEISNNAYNILKTSTDANGNKFKIYKIHQPKPLYRSKKDLYGIKEKKGTLPRQLGERLVASYINFYIANGAIVMPIFNDPNDQLAFNTLNKLFPDRKVIKINAHELILGGGGIHCITKEVPSK